MSRARSHAAHLGFLEAQSWRLQLSQVAAAPFVLRPSVTSAPTTARSSRRLWGHGLAIAASLLLAFGLGTRLAPQKNPTAQQTSMTQATDGVAESPLAINTNTVNTNTVTTPASPT